MTIAASLGYPRTGPKRELKRALESYGRGETTEADLLGAAQPSCKVMLTTWFSGLDEDLDPALGLPVERLHIDRGLRKHGEPPVFRVAGVHLPAPGVRRRPSGFESRGRRVWYVCIRGASAAIGCTLVRRILGGLPLRSRRVEPPDETP